MRTGYARLSDDESDDEPVHEVTCRRGGCAGEAGPDDLCERHGAEQTAMRRRFLTAVQPATRDLSRQPGRSGPTAWRLLAACRSQPPEVFFPPVEHRGSDYGAARAICAGCCVIAECLAAGLDERFGIWGGLSPRERQLLRRRLEQERRVEERRPA